MMISCFITLNFIVTYDISSVIILHSQEILVFLEIKEFVQNHSTSERKKPDSSLNNFFLKSVFSIYHVTMLTVFFLLSLESDSICPHTMDQYISL